MDKQCDIHLVIGDLKVWLWNDGRIHTTTGEKDHSTSRQSAVWWYGDWRQHLLQGMRSHAVPLIDAAFAELGVKGDG